MLRNRLSLPRIIAATAVLAAFSIASYAAVAGQTPEPGATPAETPPAWDESAVWQSSVVDLSVWQEVCGTSPGALDPAEGLVCGLEVMAHTGASAQAVEFFQRNGYFLESFEELGLVDYGRGAAPWFNMGRPTQQLFLNASPDGSPDIVDAPLDALDGWQQEPSYTEVAASDPYLSPWHEYGTLEVSTLDPQPGVTQLIEIAMPLQSCRACAPVGFATVRYLFDAQGQIVEQALLPFTPPEQ